MTLKDIKIGFIGAGNMGTAIINGIINSNIIKSNSLHVSDINTDRLNDFKNLGVNIYNNNNSVVDNSDVVIIAVKPNIYATVLKEISKVKQIDKKIFVSIAPGITIQSVKKYFDKEVKVIRVMPNTPALIGEGMTALCYEPPVKNEEISLINEIFKCIGEVETISEKNMNAVVAVNGSSPAYVYIMIEAMADAAVLRGIPRDAAYKLAAQSVAGAAKMVLKTDKHPAQLKDMVCSPGGTTIQAVFELEKKGFRSSIISAMEKCTEKSIELSK